MIRLSRKIAYSFGAMAMAIAFQAFSTYIVFFYVDVIKLPAYLAAVGMLVYTIWNAINDPIAGYISDHTHTRWGRRIPYIAAGAIPLGLVYYLLWIPPAAGVTQTGWLFAYFLAGICLFDAFYSVTIINWSCLYPEMFHSVKDRSQVNALRQAFTLIGLFLGIAVPPLIYGGLGWGWMGAIMGSIISCSILIALWGSREHREFSHEIQLPLWQSVTSTFKNRAFLTYAAANLLVQYSFITILASVPFFAKYVLDVSHVQTAMALGIVFLAALPSMYLWEKLTIKFGARNCFMAAIVLLISGLWPLFSVQSIESVFQIAAFLGVGLSGLLLMTDILIADVIDEDETHTGTRREGMYFGVNAFIGRFAIGLEVLTLGLIFSSSGYNPYVYTQPREFLAGLHFLIAGFPMIALALAFVILLFYPLSGKRLLKMEEEVEVIHQQKGVND